MEPLLRVDELLVQDEGGATRLDVQGLDLGEGHVVALVGSSGAGKTTLLRALLDLLHPSLRLRARIRWKGMPQEPRTLRGRIAWVPQEPREALDPLRSVGDQIAEVARQPRAGTDPLDLADRVGLDRHLLARRPATLSGGQRQRALLAAAWAARPQLIALDEPTASLDAIAADAVLHALRTWARAEGTALLWVTHDRRLARRHADRIHRIEDGKIVADTPDPPLPRRPAMPDAANLVMVARGLTANTLRGVDVALRAGDALAVLGASGAGKTTLCRALLGAVDRGSVVVRGRELTGLRGEDLRRARRWVQLVGQDPGSTLTPGRPIGDQIRDSLAAHGLDDDADGLLARVGLDAGQGTRAPDRLSGGERQRAALARAMATRPDVLVLDEWTSALDATTTARLLKTWADVVGERRTATVIATHDLDVAQATCHEALVLHDGGIAEQGATDQVISRPASNAMQALAAAWGAAEAA